MCKVLFRSISLFALLLALTLGPTESALAAPAFYDGNSADGRAVVFTTKDQLLESDTDQELDVYVRAYDTERNGYVTREVSVGPGGGNDTLPARYVGMSSDGKKVFFSTEEQLLTADHDEVEDIYLRDLEKNETFLVSGGDSSCVAEGCGNGGSPAEAVPNGVADDGSVVYFSTDEALTGPDEDGSEDVYAHRIATAKTVLVSAADASCSIGDCGNGGEDASLWGIDRNGDRAVFRTTESLSSDDLDQEADFYLRDLAAGETELVTVGGICPGDLPAGQSCVPSYGAISPDGSQVYFETAERLSLEDTDSAQDVYAWSSGNLPTLISISATGGNGGQPARYAPAAANGKVPYFLTVEQLDPADKDGEQDVYRYKEGTASLVSIGEGGRGNGTELASLDWASTEGAPERAVFSTGESLVAEDTDSSQDVYERAGGVTALISTGPKGSGEEFNASFGGAASDGSSIFFVTSQKLVTADTDKSADLYRRSAAGTALVSTGQINGNFEIPVSPQGVSDDGSKAFFVSSEPLTEGDNDAEADVYGWSEPSTTLLFSVGNGIPLGAPPPTLSGTAPGSPNASITPAIIGSATAEALIKVYRTTNCSGPVVAQGTAEQLASPGLTLTTPVAAGTTTFFSATAESKGLASSCSASISYRQEDPPPPPAEEGTGGGTDGGSGGGGSSSGSSTGSGSGGGSKTRSGGSTKNGVTYLTPVPHITFGPASKTRLRRPTFRFLDATGQPNTNFFCRVDKQRWRSCGSPFKLAKQKLGRHVFSIKAVNAVGTSAASPVRRSFKVVAR